MALYKYKAINQRGEKVEGTHNGNSKMEVISYLRQSHLHPVKITETGEEREFGKFSIFTGIKTKDIAVFCRQFYTMLNAGIPIINCLQVLSIQTENKKFRSVIENIYEEIQKGLTFSDAMRSQKKVFPELLINMVDAGEVSGNLDKIMERMAVHYEKENKINNKIKSAMVYPIVLSILSMVIIIFLLTFVMPTFIGMFQGSSVALPGPTRLLLTISYTLTHYWYLYALFISALIYGFSYWKNTADGKLIFDKLILKIPVIRSTVKKIITTRFSRTLSTLLASGIPLMDSLESTGKVVGNSIVEVEMKNVIDEVAKGSTLADPLGEIGVFPPMLISMIRIGEESGALDEILDKTANFFDEESETALQKMTTLIEPLMIVVMALVIGFIVLAMVLPIFDMVNTIQM